MLNEEDVDPDCLRRVCLIEGVEYPTVLCQRLSFRQGDAAGVSPGCCGVVVEGASGKVMHEGAVRAMAKGAGGDPEGASEEEEAAPKQEGSGRRKRPSRQRNSSKVRA